MKRSSKKNKVHLEHGRRVFVALSGGVDSSVACALLKEAGYDVTAVFMRCFQGERYGFVSSSCTTARDERDARRVAARLNIPFLALDFIKEYKKSVIEYMIYGYRKGTTPNPDVMCNKWIKFGLFLKEATKRGADMIATGHYVRLGYRIKNIEYRKKINKILNPKSYILHSAVDKNKDQSYFLWQLKQKQLARCLFPIGGYTKPQVRELAKKFGLPTAEKKDSQGICFVGKVSLYDFLEKYLPPKKGDIVGPDGRVIGRHDGAWFYTPGQRHGFGAGGGGPFFVVKKDVKNNALYVGKRNDPRLYAQQIVLKNVHWISGKPKYPIGCMARIRYRQPLQKVKLLDKKGTVIAIFERPQFAPACGQSLVFYKNGIMLGGGILFPK